MNIETKEVYGNKYKVANGTYYHSDTPDKVIRILENSRLNNQRIRLFYGNTENGRDWMETWETIGTIGRSCGNVQIPLLIKNNRSMGGGAILDNCIVKITIDKKVVYQAENYYLPEIVISECSEVLKREGYKFSVIAKYAGIFCNVKSKEKAENLVNFYKGLRNRP